MLRQERLCRGRRGKGRAEDNAEVLNEESDEGDGDLEVAIEEQQNFIDVTEVCVSVERCVDVCWQGKETRLLKVKLREVKRSDVDIWKNSIAIPVKSKRKRTERNSSTCQQCSTQCQLIL